MDSTQALLLALSVIGGLVSLIGSLILMTLRAILAEQKRQGQQITVLNALILGVEGAPGSGMAARVDDIHRWRNTLQQEELERYRQQERERLHLRLSEGSA